MKSVLRDQITLMGINVTLNKNIKNATITINMFFIKVEEPRDGEPSALLYHVTTTTTTKLNIRVFF